MKRSLQFVIAIIIVGWSVLPAVALDISAGIKAGPGIARLTGPGAQANPGTENKSLLGFSGGGVFGLNFTSMLGAEIDFLISTKGMENDSIGDSLVQSANLTYLEIPVLAKFIIPLGAPVRPVLFAGPSLGICMASNQKISGLPITAPIMNGSYDLIRQTNVLDLNLFFGVGAEIAAGSGRFIINAYYSMGLSEVMKKLSPEEIAARQFDPIMQETKNAVIGMMAGYVFTF